MNRETKLRFDRQFAAVRSITRVTPRNKRPCLSIKHLTVGGIIRLDNGTYRVDKIDRYEETTKKFKKKTGFVSTELTLWCIETATNVTLEWEEDDELTACITEKEIRFSEVRDDKGKDVDEDDLDQIVRDRDVVVVNGISFHYDDDWEGLFVRGSDPSDTPEKAYFYEFVAHDGSMLTIEEWIDAGGAEDYKLYIARPVPLTLIEIISIGETYEPK